MAIQITNLHESGKYLRKFPPNNFRLLGQITLRITLKCKTSARTKKGRMFSSGHWIALGFSWTPTWTYGFDVPEVSDGQRVSRSEAVLG